MSEDQGTYQTDVEAALEMLGVGYNNSDPSVVIEKPRSDLSIRDKGLEPYKIWGWVKVSAKFINHIKNLKGARLAIWMCIALTIDETGKCNLKIVDIVKLTGYSRSEVIESLSEMDEMGYLSSEKEAGKSSIYEPNFAARGYESPSSDPSRKTTRPVSSLDNPSSSSTKNSVPTSKELKELNINEEEKNNILKAANKTMDTILEYERQAADQKPKAWKLREKFSFNEHILALADLCVRKFGEPAKKDVSLWLEEIGSWVDSGVRAVDWTRAEAITSKYENPVLSVTGMTKAIKFAAQERKNKKLPVQQKQQEQEPPKFSKTEAIARGLIPSGVTR